MSTLPKSRSTWIAAALLFFLFASFAVYSTAATPSTTLFLVQAHTLAGAEVAVQSVGATVVTELGPLHAVTANLDGEQRQALTERGLRVFEHRGFTQTTR